MNSRRALLATGLVCVATSAAAGSPNFDLGPLLLTMLVPLAVVIALFLVRQTAVLLLVPKEQRASAPHRTRTRRWLTAILAVVALEVIAIVGLLFVLSTW